MWIVDKKKIETSTCTVKIVQNNKRKAKNIDCSWRQKSGKKFIVNSAKKIEKKALFPWTKIQKNTLFTWVEEEKGEKENQKNW